MKVIISKNLAGPCRAGSGPVIGKKGNAWQLAPLVLLMLLGSQLPAAAQAGKDGPVTVVKVGTVLNEYTGLTADAAANATTLTVASSSLNANGRFAGALAAGDLLLIVQPQGATIDATNAASYGTVLALNNAGRYQLVEVASVPSATSIVLSCRLVSAFSTVGHSQVVRVPRYTTLVLGAGATVTAPAWNGSTGGVVAIETTGNVTLDAGAALDASALGFRGGAVGQSSHDVPNSDLGYRSADAAVGAAKGEGIAGSATEYDNLSGRYGRGAPANGGGGGNSHSAAGGGGANAAASGLPYTGLGNPDRGPGNAYDAAWNLEAVSFATAVSSGGGRGGYSYSSADQDALVLAPGQAGWGGDQRQNKGGLGGHPVASAGRAFFGGGGGAGDSDDGAGTAGAAGGGLLLVVAGGAVSGGSLIADGGTVTALSGNDAAGGGGGGGSVVVSTGGLVSSALLARGGTGGSQDLTSNEAEGAGGGGGGGYVAYGTGSPISNVSGGLNGTSNSLAVTEFRPNGGTRGGAGRVASNACLALLCPAAAADVATSISFAANPLPVNQVATINVIFINNGPDPAADVVRLVRLPAGLGAVAVTTVSGTGTYNNGTGEVTFVPALLAALAGGASANATISYTPTAVGRVVVASSISTTSAEACQTGNNVSDDNTLVVVAPADLQVTLSGPATAPAAASITYTATLRNSSAVGPGTADATSVVLVVQLPRALLTTAFPAGAVYDFNTGIARISVGTVSRGAPTLSYDFTFSLPNNTQPAAGTASASGFEPDPNPANNNGTAAAMKVATTVTLPACTGTSAGTTFDNTSPATQGLYAEYYKNYFNDVLTFFDPPKVADLTRTDANVNYTANDGWGDLSTAIGGGTNAAPENYSARYRGYLTIATAGSYTFSLLSDDAAYLWLDNSARATPPIAADAVVKDPGQHSPRSSSGPAVLLSAGTHPLLALYGDESASNRFQIFYSGPDTGNMPVVIPASALCNRQFSGPLATVSSGAGQAGKTDFRLYPNPAPRRVSLAFTGALSTAAASTIFLTDLTGRLLRQYALVAGATIPTLDLGLLPTGLYLVRVEQNGLHYTQRLLHTAE